jgi:homoprotocatechuate degradation regulator HpaR
MLTKTMRDLDHSLPMLLLRAREAAMARFRPLLAAAELTEQQWRVLRVLRERNGIEARELAERTLMLRPSLSGVLDRLERDGLVERRSDEADGRKVRLMLTRKSRRLYERLAPQLEKEYARMQARLTDSAWNDLYAALEQLVSLNESRR